MRPSSRVDDAHQITITSGSLTWQTDPKRFAQIAANDVKVEAQVGSFKFTEPAPPDTWRTITRLGHVTATADGATFDLYAGDSRVGPISIGLWLTGFPYVGSDIAGYMSQGTTPTDEELFYRWTTFGALSPVMRTHHGRSARSNTSRVKREVTAPGPSSARSCTNRARFRHHKI